MKKSQYLLGMALMMVVGLFSSCAKTVEGQQNLWTSNINMLKQLSSEYRMFANDIAVQKQKAEAKWKEAEGISDEEKKIDKMSEANNLASNPFKYLRDMKGKIKDAKETIKRAYRDRNIDRRECDRKADRVEDAIEDAQECLMKGETHRLQSTYSALNSAHSQLSSLISKSKKSTKKKSSKVGGDKDNNTSTKTSKPTTKKCAYCGKVNKSDISKCPGCGALV